MSENTRIEWWGTLANGRTARRYRIEAPSGEYAVISDYGATLCSLFVPDKSGALADIVLGYDTLQEYCLNPKNVGATVGRYANRIAYGEFPLDGKTVRVSRNRPPHCIHGGEIGFDQRAWDLKEHSRSRIVLTLISEDGDQGFPGELCAEAEFDMSEPHTLSVTYSAISDRKTVCSLANHSYWNLSGHDSGRAGLSDHELIVHSDAYAEIDEEGIPTGRLTNVEGTAYDLRTAQSISALIRNPALRKTKGLDHAYALCGTMSEAAVAVDRRSGRVMRVVTDLPAMQVYLGGNLPEGLKGKNGAVYGPHSAFCLETQQFPDAPNHPGFPCAIIEPNVKHEYHTKYVFLCERPEGITNG